MKNLTKYLLIALFLFCTKSFSQAEPDSTISVKSIVKMEQTKSPTGALVRSAIIPGLGQFYNESYWKIPLIYGIFAAQSYYYIQNNKRYSSFAQKYDETGNESYKNFRDHYKDARDQILVWGIVVYLIQVLDAYVDAHLFDFNVTENPITKDPELSFRLNF